MYKVRQSSFNKLSKWRVASTIPFIFRDILNQELTSFNTVGVKITKSNSLTHGDTLTFCWLRVLIDLNKGKAITTHHSVHLGLARGEPSLDFLELGHSFELSLE